MARRGRGVRYEERLAALAQRVTDEEELRGKVPTSAPGLLYIHI
jgi:hypothetical protein